MRHRGLDVTSSREQRLVTCSDEEQLLWATEHGRALYTYNAADFCRLHAQFGRSGRNHAGIIIGDQQTISVREELHRFLRLNEAKNSAHMENNLEFLSNWRFT